MHHLAGKSRRLLDILEAQRRGQGWGDPQIYSHLCLNRYITKSASEWLRSLRERMMLKRKKRLRRSLGESDMKGTEEGTPRW